VRVDHSVRTCPTYLRSIIIFLSQSATSGRLGLVVLAQVLINGSWLPRTIRQVHHIIHTCFRDSHKHGHESASSTLNLLSSLTWRPTRCHFRCPRGNARQKSPSQSEVKGVESNQFSSTLQTRHFREMLSSAFRPFPGRTPYRQLLVHVGEWPQDLERSTNLRGRQQAWSMLCMASNVNQCQSWDWVVTLRVLTGRHSLHKSLPPMFKSLRGCEAFVKPKNEGMCIRPLDAPEQQPGLSCAVARCAIGVNETTESIGKSHCALDLFQTINEPAQGQA
jgi:hypothetical protein